MPTPQEIYDELFKVYQPMTQEQLAHIATMLNTGLTLSNAQKGSLQQEINWMLANWQPKPVVEPPLPPLPPSTPITAVLIGISGNSNLNGAAERWFDSGSGISKVAPRRSKADCPRIHASWKVLGVPAPSDAQIIAAFRNLLDGDKVEVEHESDVKYRKDKGASKAANLANRLAAKNAFYAQVKRLREAGTIAKVDVVNTYSSYTWEINDQERFKCDADVVGADLDGGNFPKDYGDPGRLTKIVAFATKYYNGRWTAPEFGWSDTVPGQRMPTIKAMIPRIAAFKPEEIQFFDSTSFSPVLTAGELVEFAQIVEQYNL